MDTRFKKGHKPTEEQKLKMIEGLKKSWLTRSDRHGMKGTKFHNTWRSMTTRCRGTCGPDSIRKYRDKGITVCERWLKFKNFYEDMYPSYIEGLTIDRIENSKGYYKENCRWATSQQQSNNRTNNVRVEFNGQKLTMREWSILLGRSYEGLRWKYHHKYKQGLMTLEELLTMKVGC